MSTQAALMSSESEDWYTPSQFVEAVRTVLETIELDPASCEYANRVVKAVRYFTKEQNGLMQAWRSADNTSARVFLNGPYGKTNGKSNQAIWSDKAIAEYSAGNIKEMIVLVNAATGDKWFDVFKPYWMCLTPRIHFYTEAGTPTQPTHGNAFVYFGDNPKKFADTFYIFGRIVPPDPYAQVEIIKQELWSLNEDAA